MPRPRSLPLALVIAAGCAVALLSFGPRASLGLFLTPMTVEMGWSRETFALAVAIQNILWGLGQPVAGMIADRYGTGRVIACGGVLYAAGLALMSWAPSPAWLYLSGGIMIGLALAACSFSIVLAAFSRIVPPERRSWAFGMGTAAGSLGQFLFAPLGLAFIEAYGWREALQIMGVFLLVLPLLAVLLAGRGQSARVPGASAAPADEQTFRAALGEAFGHRSYLLLVAGFFTCGFHVAFITTHLPPYLSDQGIDAQWGAWAIAVIGLFNVIGSYTSGIVSGRMSKRLVLTFIYTARSLAIALFLLVPLSPASIVAFSAVIGLLWLSTVPPTSGLVVLMFGARYMGTLSGVVFLSHQVGAFLGVWLGGALYEATGGYGTVWWLSVALGFIAAAIHWPIRERPVARLATSG